MTFYVGQRVKCIREIEIETPWGTIYTGPTPVLDAVYTVSGFGDTGMQPMNDVPDAECGITVAELSGIRARMASTEQWQELAWPIAIFQPLIERQTDIGFARQILRTVSEKEPA